MPRKKAPKRKLADMQTLVTLPYSCGSGAFPLYHDSESPVTQLELHLLKVRVEMWARPEFDQQDLDNLTYPATTYAPGKRGDALYMSDMFPESL
jgi:hypothetical protein